jgi:hypothetical protein
MFFYATRIRMCYGCEHSKKCSDIEAIYLEGVGINRHYKKEDLHNHLKEHPNSIRVKLGAQPFLIPATSYRSEKYVRNEANDTPHDNLLSLPRN